MNALGEATFPTANVPTEPIDVLGEIKKNRDQVDRILYLSSLASSFKDIDPLMDRLREITATWNTAEPMSLERVTQLRDLEKELKDYLITRDPVRTFTAETLEEQVKDHEETGRGKQILSLFAVLGLSILAGGLAFIVPLPLSNQERNMLAIPLYFIVLHIGISWFYLSALKNFKQEIRKAFRVMCIGIVLFGVTFSHYAAVTAFSLDRFPLFQYGGLPLLVALPFIFIFFGLRIYAKQLQIPSKVVSWVVSYKFIIAMVVLIAIAYALAPNVSKASNEVLSGYFSSVSGAMLWLFAGMGAILAFKIRKAVTRAYARPLTGLFIYLALSAVASLYTNLSFGTGEFEGDTPLYVIMAVAGIPVQLLLLWTGYVFKRELSR